MKRIAVTPIVLLVVMAMVLLAGCSSTDSASKSALRAADAEVTLVAHQAGTVAASSGSLGMELSMPLWLVLNP